MGVRKVRNGALDEQRHPSNHLYWSISVRSQRSTLSLRLHSSLSSAMFEQFISPRCKSSGFTWLQCSVRLFVCSSICPFVNLLVFRQCVAVGHWLTGMCVLLRVATRCHRNEVTPGQLGVPYVSSPMKFVPAAGLTCSVHQLLTLPTVSCLLIFNSESKQFSV